MYEILDGIKMLASSQGYYGRLLNQIHNLDYDDFIELTRVWEGKNFKNMVDFILYIEG